MAGSHYFRVVLLLALFCNCIILAGQNQTRFWYFGIKAGLDFNTSPPSALTNGQLIAGEGCSAISDAAGNLLFYHANDTVFNSAHQAMANGTGFFASSSATQSSIILKKPGSNSIYYIFYLRYNATSPFWYATVDMSLAAGMGSVTAKNVVLYNGICVEKLAATKHCNGTDIWVMVHENNNSNFRAYLLTATGVNTTAIVSSVGASNNYYVGTMKFSPNGRKLGHCTQFFVPGELLDFDNSTGLVSNPLFLSNGPGFCYGCEFSPDGTKFYVSAQGNNGIHQWDLCAGSPMAIVASKYVIPADDHQQLQLATDGKIYTSPWGQHYVGLINNPDLMGSACNFIDSAVYLAGRKTSYGLPNFMSNYFWRPQPFQFVQDTPACGKLSFSSPCVPSGSTLTARTWNFGDPGSAANTSTLANPSHVFSGSGAYTVQLILYYMCGSDTLRQQVMVPNFPQLSVSGNTVICFGQSTTLNATGNAQYSWGQGMTGSSIQVSPSVTTTYTLTGSNGNSTCQSLITVSTTPLPTLAVTGNTAICNGSSIVLSATGATSYSWNTGATVPIITVTPTSSSSFTITGTGTNGCSASAIISVSLLASPMLTVMGNSILCQGESSTFSVSGADSYTWTGGTNAPVITLSPANTITLSVTGQNTLSSCTTIITLTMQVNDCMEEQEIFSEDPSWQLFPNPTNQFLRITSSLSSPIVIYDSNGKLVHSDTIERQCVIDVSAWPAGIYLICLINHPKERRIIKFD